MSETKICLRPECGQALHTGKRYCSTKCAALDRSRARVAKQTITITSLVPAGVANTFLEKYGEDAAPILNEMAMTLQERAEKDTTPAPPLFARTEGDWNWTYFLAGQDRRPSDALDFEIIDEMGKSGIVQFVENMKIASLMSVWRNDMTWKLYSPDRELQEVATANEQRNLPRMMLDIYRSALAYGAYFGEKVFEFKTPYQLGLSKSRSAAKRFAVPQVPKPVNPRTVDRIKRRDDDMSFNGYVQLPKSTWRMYAGEIDVPLDQALVIPYRGQFRNLWGESYRKPMYPSWFWYEIALRSWVRFMERMGTPVAVCYAPSRGKVQKPGTTTLVDAMTWGLAVAGNISKSNAASLPSDVHPETKLPLWRLEYLTAEDRGDVFAKALEFLTQEIVRAGMSADRAITQSSGGVGSYAIGEIHNAATQLHNELIAIEVLAYLNQYYYPDYARYNRGEDGPPIWMMTEGLDPAEKERLFKLMSISGNAEGFNEALMMVDWRRLMELNDVPVLSEKDVDELKEKLHKEAMKQQRDSIKNAALAGGKAPQPSQNQNPIQAKEKDEELQKQAEKLELLAFKMANGQYVPIILSDEEMQSMIERQQEGTVELFNPFHIAKGPKGGQFAPRQGGGGGMLPGGGDGNVGGGAGGADVKGAKPGSFLKTTGRLLGLAGLGTVALMLLGATTTTEVNTPMAEERDKMAGLPDKLPDFASDEEALAYVTNHLRNMGLAGIPNDVAISMDTSMLSGNMIAGYDADTNTIHVDSMTLEAMRNGDPRAMWVMAHELSHGNQEANGVVVDIDSTGEFAGYVEGQNDLVTAMAVSNMYGEPVTQNMVGVGYPDEAQTWAGMASVWQDKTGENAVDFTMREHAFGDNMPAQREVLWQLFPDRLGGYVDSGAWPPIYVIENWLEEDYSVDSSQAFEDMVQEALR